jgi:predicted protein tyrosine phosphatase
MCNGAGSQLRYDKPHDTCPPHEYDYMQPELVALLELKVGPYLR